MKPIVHNMPKFAAMLRGQQAEAAKLDAATCLRHAKRLPVRGTQTGGGQVAANLPVRRSGCEGGKEFGYGW